MRVTKERLREMYDTMKSRELMKALGGISASRLYKILDEAGIERKIKDRKPRNYFKIEIVG